MNKAVLDALRDAFSPEELRFSVKMSEFTTFRVGGPAAAMLEPGDEETLLRAFRLCGERNVPYFVLGNGSNLLVRDGGLDALVIHLGEKFSGITVQDTRITARGGDSLAMLSRAAYREGLTGLEFACGIPGSVGGGMAMNAGAYGGQLSDTVVSARVLDPEKGEIFTLGKEELQMGYRTSRVLTRGEIVLEAEFELAKGDKDEIKAMMDDFAARRRDKQPLSYPSAGSTFKRPEGHFAGALIEQAGLKGVSVGGAQVSEKHAGFVINTGSAATSDVLRLIALVQERVYENSGVRLEPEVRIIGEDYDGN